MEFKGTQGKWFVGIANMKDTNKDELVIAPESHEKTDEGYRLIACISPIDKHDEVDKANALLISKAPEMLEKLKECIDILDVKCTDGCINKTWRDYQNGNGEDIGIEIDRFIKESKQLIKSATEL